MLELLFGPNAYQALIWFYAAVVCSTTVYALAATWAICGTVHWFWRWAPLFLLLVAPFPIGAYELSALFAAQTTTIVGGLGLLRALRRRGRKHTQSADADASKLVELPELAYRFRMTDVLMAVLLASSVFAIVRLYPSEATTSITIGELWPFVALGASTGCVSLISSWFVSSGKRWFVRGCCVAIVIAVAAGVENLTRPNVTPIDDEIGIATYFGLLVVMSSQAVLLAVCSILIRHALPIGLGEFGLIERTPQNTSLQHGKSGTLAARGVLLIVATAYAWLLLSLYWALLPPAMPPRLPLPMPNGYDELARAAAGLNWQSVPSEDYEAASAQECQQFVLENETVFSQARIALAEPAMQEVDYLSSDLQPKLNKIQNFRSLCRAWCAAGKAAAATGNTALVAQCYLNVIRLAHSMSRGGIIIDELVAVAIEGVGAIELAKTLPKLRADDLSEVRVALEKLVNSYEPLDAIFARDGIYEQLWHGWSGRLITWLGLYGNFNKTVTDLRTESIARLRLLIAEAAVRGHVLTAGAPPESLRDLVHNEISVIPIDPYSGNPLIYRRVGDTYLLYSVGTNGVDDGGQRVTQYEAIQGHKGDLFFDAAPNSPRDASESHSETSDA